MPQASQPCQKLNEFSGKDMGDLLVWITDEVLPKYADCAARHEALRNG